MNVSSAKIFSVAALVVVPWLTATGSSAQIFFGSVIDASSREPIAATEVSLIDLAGDPVARVLSDEAGEFVLNAPGPGDYILQAAQLGYQTIVSEPIDIGSN